MSRDLVFQNANVITMDDQVPFADGLVIRDGKIHSLNVGDASGDAQIIDCTGKTLVPGFVDTHIHLHAFARRTMGNDLSSVEDLTIEKVREYIAHLVSCVQPGEWITIFGYDPYNIAEKRLLTRWDIDCVSPENPIRMYHRSGQGQLCNSRALEVMGIDIGFEDLDGGMVDREIPSGEPNGMLYGMDEFISSFIPREDDSFMERAAAEAGKALARAGITAVHDVTLRNSFSRIRTLKSWVETGLLPQRLRAVLGIEAFWNHRAWFQEGFSDDPIVWGVKFILNEIRGRLNIDTPKLTEYVMELQSAGIPGCIHCVDEVQLEAAIKAIAAAREVCPESKVFHRIEHTSLCTDEMMDRMKALDVTVASQPAFLYYSGERYLDTIEKNRQQRLYRFGSLQKKEITVAFGSDAPISPANPLKGIYSAVTRKTARGRLVAAEEAVSVMEALKMYTLYGAKALGMEKQIGTLTPGKWADVVMLDQNVLSVDPEELKNINVDMTVIGGTIVWKK